MGSAGVLGGGPPQNTDTWSQINSELSLGNGTNRKNMDERHIFASKIIPNGALVDENDHNPSGPPLIL